VKIPFFNYPDVYLRHKNIFKKIIDDVGSRGAFIMQDDLLKFENKIAEYSGSNFAVGVANATDALEMLVSISDIKNGDEIIISTHTMIATASAIASTGAKPVPIDCGVDHLINVESIEKAINSRTKAIMPTQLNGRTADMDSICKIAKDNNLIIIEDSAQALGSKYKGKNAGTFGLGGCISFYPAKVLGCLGDGGMILCNEKDSYEKLIMLRDHGRNSKTGEVLLWGRNSRLDNLQAAFLGFQFETYESVVLRRREIANIYNTNLKDLPNIILPPAPNNSEDHYDIYQNYEIEADRRDDLKKYLYDNGVGTLIQWGGLGVHQFKKLGFNTSLPFSEKIFKRMLLIPINMTISNKEIDYICDKIISFYKSF
jgi:dTDP-4-amino-4,6-dideoxygalactose transaminase